MSTADEKALEAALEEADPSDAEAENIEDENSEGDEEEEDSESSSESEDSDSSFDESTIVRPKETLLQGRGKRATAGQRMAALLDDEEESESLFTTKFGEEIFEEDNSEYEGKDEESWDELDTDFDEAEEADEAPVDEENDELKKKRRVYLDPLKPAKKRRTNRNDSTSRRPAGPRAPRAPRQVVSPTDGPVRKSSRKAIVELNKEREKKLTVSKAKAKIVRKAVPKKPMTQTERLRQAVHTERENKLSLLRFQQKEDAKKKSVLKGTTYKGPVIRYHSKTLKNEDGTKESKNYLVFCNINENFLTEYFPGARISTATSNQ